MKKYLILLIVALFCVSCSKDDDKELTYEQLIVGRWKGTNKDMPEGYYYILDFHKNNAFDYYSEGVKQEGEHFYSISGNILYRQYNFVWMSGIKTYNDTATILTLNKDIFKYSIPNGDTFTLERQ